MSCNLLTNEIDVYLSLNGDIIPNHGYVMISDIGSTTDDTALLCHTNRPPARESSNSGGDWFAPDGTRVNGMNVRGFKRNRGPMVVRLKRTTGSPAEGIYVCRIWNSLDVLHSVYVGLYNVGNGE